MRKSIWTVLLLGLMLLTAGASFAQLRTVVRPALSCGQCTENQNCESTCALCEILGGSSQGRCFATH